MSRFAHLSLAVLPLLLGLSCLALLDASEQTSPPAVSVVEESPPTRLLVLMVDSLDLRDVETQSSLPKLHEHLRRVGLHGPVRACVDGVTIPCVSAMITGYDHASGFSPLRNFGAARDLTGRSVLGALQDHGHPVGYFGDPLLAKALDGLAILDAPEHHGPVDDEQVLQKALRALEQERIELAFVHLLSLDETAHKLTAEGSAYRRALQQLDDRLDRAFRSVRPDDHVVILGDHGHEPSGRHSADIGTQTYAAYFGPRFARPVERAMVMTDHAGVWSRLFGLRWGPRGFADDYFEGKALGTSEPRLSTRPRHPLPLAACLLLALSLGLAGPRVRAFEPAGLMIGAVAGTAAMIASSILVPHTFSSLASDGAALSLSALVGMVGAAILMLIARHARWNAVRLGTRDRYALLLTGALLLALPTAEPTAGLKAPTLWCLVCLVALTVQTVRSGDRRSAWKALSCVVVLAVLALVRVRAYLPRAILEDDRGPLWGWLLPATLLIAAVASVGGSRAALAAVFGVLAAPLLAEHAGRWLIAPCALMLPMSFLAFRRIAWFDVVCLLLPIASYAFFPRDTAQLASVAACWWLWAALPPLLRDRGLLLRASSFSLLTWLSFWTAMSTRIGGIDYDFYFRWLPVEAAATRDAIQQGLLTATKCMLPAIFGALLARRAGALPLDLLKGAEQLMRVRLALTIVFVIGLSLSGGGLQLLYDGTQEIAFWVLMFAVLGLVSAANQATSAASNPT